MSVLATWARLSGFRRSIVVSSSSRSRVRQNISPEFPKQCLRYIQPRGVFMDAPGWLKRQVSIVFGRRSELDYPKEFILFMVFVRHCFVLLECQMLKKKRSSCTRDIEEEWLLCFPDTIISLKRLLRTMAQVLLIWNIWSQQTSLSEQIGGQQSKPMPVVSVSPFSEFLLNCKLSIWTVVSLSWQNVLS